MRLSRWLSWNSINKSLSAIDGIKAFEDNVSIKSSLSYNVSAKYLNTILYENRPVSDQGYPYTITFTGRPNASAYLGFPYWYFLDEQAIYCE